MIFDLEKASDVNLVGNKAKGLYDLIKLELNVPKGFVIKSGTNKDCIKKFIKRKCSNKGNYVVRSSSNFEDSKQHSFAGLFDTYIGVAKEDLFERILDVMYMRENKRLDEFCEKIGADKSKIRVAVIVQRILPSEISGICFTKHPSTNNENEIYVEAILGLGEYIVSGEVSPDSYIIDKKTNKIKSRKIATQHKMLVSKNRTAIEEPVFSYTQKMNDNLIKELTKKSIKIKNYYGKEMDLEFGIYKNKLYLLQARPITT